MRATLPLLLALTAPTVALAQDATSLRCETVRYCSQTGAEYLCATDDQQRQFQLDLATGGGAATMSIGDISFDLTLDPNGLLVAMDAPVPTLLIVTPDRNSVYWTEAAPHLDFVSLALATCEVAG